MDNAGRVDTTCSGCQRLLSTEIEGLVCPKYPDSIYCSKRCQVEDHKQRRDPFLTPLDVILERGVALWRYYGFNNNINVHHVDESDDDDLPELE